MSEEHAIPPEPADDPVDREPMDRGIPSVQRVRSIQSRVTTLLGAGVMTLLGGGVLAWYYSGAFKAPVRTVRKQEDVKRSAQGEVTLPPLGPPSTAPAKAGEATALETLVGESPPAPSEGDAEHFNPDDYAPAVEPPSGTAYSPRAVSPPPMDPALARRLSGPTYLSLLASSPERTVAGGENDEGAALEDTDAPQANASAMRTLLRSSVIPTVQAERLPNERMLLAKGTTLGCTLETAVDTSLPGLVTCIVNRDVMSADGSVVLVERGSTLFGETRAVTGSTGTRVFIVWQELRSHGVAAKIDSPASDPLGRSGLPGQVDRHFFARFGAAFLTSVIEGEVARLSQPKGDATVIYNPREDTDITTEVLKSTAGIPTTVRLSPGAEVRVLVARDVDFSSVYRLELNRP